MNVSVLGCGRWGSFIGWYLSNHGHNVIQWGREGHYSYDVLKNTGRNEDIELCARINLTTDLRLAIDNSEIIIISISSQALRKFIENLKKYGKCDIHRDTFIKNFVGENVK